MNYILFSLFLVEKTNGGLGASSSFVFRGPKTNGNLGVILKVLYFIVDDGRTNDHFGTVYQICLF